MKKSSIRVFFGSYVLWMILSGAADARTLVTGFVCSILVMMLAGNLPVAHHEKMQSILNAYLGLIAYFPVLLWQVIIAGFDTIISLVYIDLPIKPGMVKVKTTLTGDTALTLLSYLISLSPGTLMVETDRTKGYMCIHWRNVASENIEEATRLIVAKHERMLAMIFGKK